MRQQFTSKERDVETGLDYFLARYYSATQGRFTSPDEFAGGPEALYTFASQASENPTFYADLTNPQSLNKYLYTYNDPLNLTDGDGHCPVCVVAVVAAAVYILMSPQTVHGPTPKDTYRERSASSAAQIVSLGAGEAVGGPLVSKAASAGGRLLSRAVNRSANAERAALQAERARLVQLLHKRELGLDPATKTFRAAEAEAGSKLEAQLGRRLSRDSSGATDFVDKSGRTYDLVGPGLKQQHFNYKEVTDAITGHLAKADRVVVDVSKLSRAQVEGIEQFRKGLNPDQAAKVIILR